MKKWVAKQQKHAIMIKIIGLHFYIHIKKQPWKAYKYFFETFLIQESNIIAIER